MKHSILITTTILCLNFFFYTYNLDQLILGGSYIETEVRKSLYKILVYGGPVLICVSIRYNPKVVDAVKKRFHWFQEKWVYLIRILWATLLIVGKQVGNVEFGTYPFVYVLVINSIVEETVFRGYVQEQLIKQYGVLKGIIQQAIMFGIVHLPFYYSHYQDGLYGEINAILGGFLPVALGPYIIFLTIGTPIILGLLRGWITYRTKSLWPSIVRHSIHNGMLLFA